MSIMTRTKTTPKNCRLCASPRIPSVEAEHDVGCLRGEFCLAWYFVGQAAAQDAVWREDFALAWLNIGTAAEVLAERDARIGRLEHRLGDVYQQVVTAGFNFERGRALAAATAPGVHALPGLGEMFREDKRRLSGQSITIIPRGEQQSPKRRVREVITVNPVPDEEE